MAPSSTSSDEATTADGLFTEPADYYAAEKSPTHLPFILEDGRTLNLRLVGHNPLWGHHLWNGARELAAYLQEPAGLELVRDASVLELGAGAGLPGLVAAMSGAKRVVITDYPDPELIENISHNICEASPADLSATVEGVGYRWGEPEPASALVSHGSFKVIFLADLNFNHSEHGALASTLVQMLSQTDPKACALVFFTPYRPWLLDKDRDFFRLAAERGLVVEKLRERTMAKVMFEEDPGDETLRRTVYGYIIRWPRANETPYWNDEIAT